MTIEKILEMTGTKIRDAKASVEAGQIPRARCQLASLHCFLIDHICPGRSAEPESEGSQT